MLLWTSCANQQKIIKPIKLVKDSMLTCDESKSMHRLRTCPRIVGKLVGSRNILIVLSTLSMATAILSSFWSKSMSMSGLMINSRRRLWFSWLKVVERKSPRKWRTFHLFYFFCQPMITEIRKRRQLIPVTIYPLLQLASSFARSYSWPSHAKRLWRWRMVIRKEDSLKN